MVLRAAYTTLSRYQMKPLPRIILGVSSSGLPIDPFVHSDETIVTPPPGIDRRR